MSSAFAAARLSRGLRTRRALLGARRQLTAERQRVAYLHRAYGLLCGVGEASVRLGDRQGLLAETCRMATEIGGFALAWVGIVDPDSARLRVEAAAGPAVDYVDALDVRADGGPRSRGPTGSTIQLGRPTVCDDLTHDPRTEPWREQAMRAGLRAAAAFPLRSGGAVIGALTLYSTEVGVFGDEEVGTLARVADILSFALDAIAREEQRAADERERVRLQAEVTQAQKLDSLGKLAGGVAHDFNNLLTGILGYAQFLADSLPPGSEAREDADEIRRASARAAALTRQLLTFSSKQPVTPVDLDLNGLTLGLSKLLRRLIGEHVELAVLPAEPAPFVHADPGQLEQVLVNLAINARDAMPNGGVLRIETHVLTLDAHQGPTGPSRGRWAMLRVHDTGVGMSEETRARLFEPFFTTKAKGKGTGLGLATCFGIVKQCGGHIRVRSEPGAGATFEVLLPAIEARDDREEREEAPPPSLVVRSSSTVRVLLVEDEPGVRTMATRALRAAGYDVVTASDGAEALRHLEAPGCTVGALVSDVVMPQLGGPELARRALALHPDLRVLLMSGYVDEGAGVLGPHPFLAKPFTPAGLTLAVRELIRAEWADERA